ncbi:Hypothetical_protein [Hexamita inflata]|uniref:Hypothetical_protein n=1 Tax=Hexamita inflata TaxID=28002 RepID=A0AA86NAL9_9EUKA|nr:Hypothetical protein HINF_LOCUS3538 [Hexamita inflata]
MKLKLHHEKLKVVTNQQQAQLKDQQQKHINTIMYIQKQVRNVSAANNVIADMCVRAKDIICVQSVIKRILVNKMTQEGTHTFIKNEQSDLKYEQYVLIYIEHKNSNLPIKWLKSFSRILLIICEVEILTSLTLFRFNKINNIKQTSQLNQSSTAYLLKQLFNQIEINKFQVCAENTQRFGSSLHYATITGAETLSCADLCDSNYFVTYGLCMLQPQYSTLLQNSTVVCEYPFVFDSVLSTCECDFGFYLNVSFCVNVVQQFSIIQKNATDLENKLKEIQNEIKISFNVLEELIIKNLTELTQNMNENDNAIIENLVNVNETVHKNIDEMKIQNTIEFKTVTDLIETKQIQTINYLTENLLNMKNNFSAIMNIVATQSYVKDVYDNIMSAVNAIAVAQNPCKEWPGSVNENGLCKCAYLGQNHYCTSFSSCCAYTEHVKTYEGDKYYKYSLKCINGITRTQQGLYRYDHYDDAVSNINSICGNQYYTNINV